MHEALPGVDAYFSFPRGMLAKSKIIRTLKKESFDTIIDLQNNLVTRRLCGALRVQRVYRFQRSRWNRWQRINLKFRRESLKSPPHVAMGYINSVSDIGVYDDGRGLELNVADAWKKNIDSRLEEYLSSIGLSETRSLPIFSPGAAHATKSPPVSKWSDLLKLLHKNGYPGQVLIGGESDKARCEEISKQIEHPVLNLTGQTSLQELIALIQMGAILISGDSGPMHIASAVKTPLVAFFGPTVPEFGFSPFRCKHELIEMDNLDCRPCTAHGSEKCPEVHFRCMEDINLEDVLDAVKRLDPVLVSGE